MPTIITYSKEEHFYSVNKQSYSFQRVVLTLSLCGAVIPTHPATQFISSHLLVSAPAHDDYLYDDNYIVKSLT